MTDHTITPVAPFGAITTLRAVNTFERIAQSFRRWNETRRTVAALRMLSPAQLDDIGLTPSDVEEIGHGGF